MKSDFINGAKKELNESLPTLVWFAVALGLIASLTSCDNTVVCPAEDECNTQVTLKNLSGLDGCGWALELQDGSRLIPIAEGVFSESTTEPTWKVDGKKLLISYTEQPVPNVCMAGTTVKVTCLSEVTTKEN